MKRIITILFAIGAVYFAACSKSNAVQTVSGTINGVPALTLYGSSGEPADYVLLSTTPADKDMNYNGNTYYYYTSPDNHIFIEVAPTNVVSSTLVTTGSKTVLSISASTVPFFASTQYTSK